MNASDKQEFGVLLKATLEVYGTSLSPAATSIWWAALERYSIDQIRMALSQHVTTGKFAPKPADVISAIHAQDGRPGPEEAWTLAPRNESETVVWNDEISYAWGIAARLIDSGDYVAARVAFKEAYDNAVRTSRNLGIPPRWYPTIGTDQHARDSAIAKAVGEGKITLTYAQKLVPDMSDAKVLPFVKQARTGLISGGRE